MGWRDWLGLGRPKTKPNERVAEDTEGPIEASPAVLAAWFMAMAASFLQAIEKAATETGISLSYNQQTALFRQVFFFCDALWYRILLPNRLLATGLIQSSSFQAYIDHVRQKAMEAIASAEHLPEEWRNWSLGVSHEALQRDSNFFMQGAVPPEWESDLSVILSLTQTKHDGSIYEFTARLYLRVCQTLNLIERRDVLAHLVWWNRLAILTSEYAKAFQKFVPVAE